MKTLTQQEYEALPIEKRRYCNQERTVTGEDGVMIDYTPVTIYLEDAEGVIEGIMSKIESQVVMNPISNYKMGLNKGLEYANFLLTEALNKLKGV